MSTLNLQNAFYYFVLKVSCFFQLKCLKTVNTQCLRQLECLKTFTLDLMLQFVLITSEDRHKAPSYLDAVPGAGRV